LLELEPLTLQNWPVWRQRLLDWIGDRSEATTPAYYAAWEFMKAQATPGGDLPPALAKDPLAWYFLGSGYLADAARAEGAPALAAIDRSEKAVRRSIQLDRTFPNAHARLASVLLRRRHAAAAGPKQGRGQNDEARNELREAR